jgi:hypothetical protein
MVRIPISSFQRSLWHVKAGIEPFNRVATLIKLLNLRFLLYFTRFTFYLFYFFLVIVTQVATKTKRNDAKDEEKK